MLGNSSVRDLTTVSLGDSAVVVVGYGLLPSFLSLDRVDLAARTQKLLLDHLDDALDGEQAVDAGRHRDQHDVPRAGEGKEYAANHQGLTPGPGDD